MPGTYEVKAELASFKTAVVPSVIVNVDAQTPINFKLEVGELTETVTVTGGSPLLKTDRADVATTFSQKQLTELPILDRNFTKFILLTPGTQQLGWQHAASENPQGSVQTMVNGQNFSGTGYQLDGTENRDPILGIIVINPNLDAIGESKITSQNYDAEFGQATAGIVSVQTKSGTNDWHGSAFEFWQGDKFQARNPFSQARPNPQTGRFIPETSKHQFGGTFGGKIIENRTFFFGAYQGHRQTQGGSRLLTVPTAAARAGDLSAYGVNIFDPASGALPENRTQFGGNVIPTGRLSPQAQNLLDLIPMPNAPGVENGTRENFIASGSETFDGDQFDVRMDHRVDSNSNLFGRFTLANFLRDGPTAFGEGGGPNFVSLGGISDVGNKSLAIGYDRSISSTLLADFRFGWFNYNVAVLPFDFGTRPAEAAGIPGLNLDDTFTSGLPYLYIEGIGGFRAGSGLDVNRCNCPLDQDESQWQMVGNVTKIWSNHTFKFGVDVRRAYNLRVPSDSHRSGELTFNTDRTRGPRAIRRRTHEALERAVDRAMDGDRALRLTRLVDVGEIEPLGEHDEVGLDRRHLPLAPEGIVDVDVDLGRVERAVLRLDLVVAAGPIQGGLDEPLGPLPQRRVADRLVRLRREREARRQADPRVGLADLAEHRLDLVGQLVRPDVDVGIVLDELADAGEPGQRAGPLVPVEPAVLAVAERQVAIRADLRAVDEGRLGAVHRLEREVVALRLEAEHVRVVEVPVARLLPQLLVDEDRRADLLVAAPRLELAHRAFERPPDHLALRVPERGARANVVEAEEVELDAEPAVVALLRLARAATGTGRAPPGSARPCRRCAGASGASRRRASTRPATASSLNGPILPVLSTCGPLHRSTNAPCS